MADDDRITDQITELLADHYEVLTQWEREFLDTLDNWDGALTAKQAEKLAQIYEDAPRRSRR